MRNKIILLLILEFVLFLPVYTIEIGTVEEAPGNFTDENGNVVGLSVDFVKEIQKRVKDTTPIEMFPAARVLSYSRTKKNYVIFTLSRSKAREKNYHWIALVMRKPLVMFARKGSDHNS